MATGRGPTNKPAKSVHNSALNEVGNQQPFNEPTKSTVQTLANANARPEFRHQFRWELFQAQPIRASAARFSLRCHANPIGFIQISSHRWSCRQEERAPHRHHLIQSQIDGGMGGGRREKQSTRHLQPNNTRR